MEESRLVLTPAIRRRVFPWRGMPGLRPPTPVDRGAIRAAFPRCWQRLEEEGPFRRIAQRLNAIIEQCGDHFERRILEVDTEAALAARSDFRNRPTIGDGHWDTVHQPFVAGLVCDWVEQRGVAFAVETLTRATELLVHYDQGLIKAGGVPRYDPGLGGRQVGFSVLQFPHRAPSGWAVLRHYLAVADDDSYAEARELASILLDDPSDELCAGLAFLFPTEGWAETLLAKGRPKFHDWWSSEFLGTALGSSVGTPEAARMIHRHGDSAPTMVARLGLAALPVIPPDLDLLVAFEAPEAVERIVPYFDKNKSSRTRVISYLNRVPQIAAHVLSPIASGEVAHQWVSRELAAACLGSIESLSFRGSA